MLNPTTTIVDLLASAGNALLKLDPETLEKLAAFHDKRFCIELTEPDMHLFLKPVPEGFEISTESDPEHAADVTLRGSLWSFARLAKDGSHSDVFHSGRIHIQGDAELGQAFQSVLSQIDLDWEELMSRFVGDFAARQTGQIFQEFGRWFSINAQSARHNFGEVLQEETRTVPAKREADDFTDEVESLRSSVERLEARINRLTAQKSSENA